MPGLRREEVALLAGVSVNYYTASSAATPASVFRRAFWRRLSVRFQLDEAERAHLFDLARAAGTTAKTRRPPEQEQAEQTYRPSVQHLLDAITGAPALACRTAAWTSWPRTRSRMRSIRRCTSTPSGQVNHAGFVFLNPRAHDFYRDWERATANDTVRRPSFRSRARPARPWPVEPRRRAVDAKRGVPHRLGRAQRPAPPDPVRSMFTTQSSRMFSLTFEMLELRADAGLTLLTYTAEPGSRSEEALNLLASWTATLDQPSRQSADEEG